MRSRRTHRAGWAAALAATALTVAGLGPPAVAAPPTADAMVQYAVAPTSGTLDALAQHLIAAG